MINVVGQNGKSPDNRHWNAFGLGNPANSSSVEIIGEINIPLEVINRHMGGACVEDSYGKPFLFIEG